MTFETVEVRMNRRFRSPVTVALYIRENKSQIEFSLAPEVWQRLQWKPGITHLEVLEGTGADEGHVQLLPAKHGAALVRRSPNKDIPSVATIRVNTKNFKHTKFKKQSVSATGAEFLPFGSSLTVMILDVIE